jgi:hypothetical protein
LWQFDPRSEGFVPLLTHPREGAGDVDGAVGYVMGMVDYVDFTEEEIPLGNLLIPLFRKWKSFEHEHELRVVVSEWPRLARNETVTQHLVPPNRGRSIRVELGRPITGIHVAPQSPEWFLDLIRSVLRTYKLHLEPIKSTLDGAPTF